jgi:hypothetical protein
MDVTALIRQGDPATPMFTTIVLGTNLPTPPVNIGPRSTPNYETNLAEPAISTIPTGAGGFYWVTGYGVYRNIATGCRGIPLQPRAARTQTS